MRNTLLRIAVPAGAALLLIAAWRAWGWPGAAAAGGGLVMWFLLHVTRTMQVLQRAAARPIGSVDSAVMLNARLQPGKSLLHVLAMTRALGQLQTEKDAQPEVFRWTDAGGSFVDCEFQQGRLQRWALTRPDPAADGPAGP